MSAADDFEIRDGVLVKYRGPGGDVRVPDGVEIIGESAFRDNGTIRRITLPAGIRQVRAFAFQNCAALEQAFLGDGLRELDTGAFLFCRRLEEIRVPDSLKMIFSAFDSCTGLRRFLPAEGAKDTVVLDGVLFFHGGTQLVCYPPAREAAFYVVPDGVTRIRAFAFRNARALRWIEVPGSVVSVAEGRAFSIDGRLSMSLNQMMTERKIAPYIAVHSRSLVPVLRKPVYLGGPLEDLPKEQWNKAAEGFLFAAENGIGDLERWAGGYADYIRAHSRPFAELAAEEEWALHRMMALDLLGRADAEARMEDAVRQGRADLTAELLVYLNRHAADGEENDGPETDPGP